MTFTELIKDIYRFDDCVNVYAIKNGNKAILIDFGSGKILDHLSKIGIDTVDYIFHTHYHRDQCFGDNLALKKSKKINIAAPEKEKRLFSEAETFWKKKSYYDIYFFKPTFFVSPYNIPLDLTFKDGDKFDWNGYQFKIIETTGHTMGSISYVIEIDGKRLVFTGDLIHSGGKVITYYDLQYYYNDNGENGIIRSYESFKKLLELDPDILLPSHGDLIQDPSNDIAILRKKFERARFIFCSERSSIEHLFQPGEVIGIKTVNLKEQFPHILHDGFQPPYIILGEHQNCILIDYAGCNFFGYEFNKLNTILNEYNIQKIDFVIPTHYHDDHTAGIPLLQQKLNIEVYALENMVDVLENPTHYRIGCLIDQPIKVDKVLKDGETFKWEDYEFKVFHFPGQTEYHMGLFTKIDGKTLFFTGDSITKSMFLDRNTNMNSINFCRLGKDVGYMKCADILLNCNPEYIAISHHGIIKVEKDYLKKYKEFISEYEPVMADIVAQENPNMGFDPNWISFKPIRIMTEPGNEITTNLMVRNYLENRSSIEIKLNLPNNWKADFENKTYYIEQNTFQEIPITIKIPNKEDPQGRTIITANIIWNGKDLGPFPDLMIDHGFKPAYSWTSWRPDKKQNLATWIYRHIQRDNKIFK